MAYDGYSVGASDSGAASVGASTSTSTSTSAPVPVSVPSPDPASVLAPVSGPGSALDPAPVSAPVSAPDPAPVSAPVSALDPAPVSAPDPAPVPWQELVVEMITRRWLVLAPLAVVLLIPLLLRHPQPAAWPALIYLTAVCVLLAAVDLRHRRLPGGLVLLSYPALAALLLIPALAHPNLSAWGRATTAAVTLGLAMHLIPNHLIGHGDAKLLGLLTMLPAWSGWLTIPPALLTFFLPVALESIALLATGRAKRGDQIAFGPPLMLGAYLYVLLTANAW